MPELHIEQPGQPLIKVKIQTDEVTFGRSEENNVVLVADEVSRNHAKIVCRGNRCVLHDLKSLNGTYVNRQRIVERVLADKDEVWFGSKCHMKFIDNVTVVGDGAIPRAVGDGDTARNVEEIREEMDRVVNSMTLIGMQTADLAKQPGTPIPEATSHEVLQMSRAFRRLDALHRASQVMAGNFDLDERLAQVLDIVMEVLGAERGFVMLREKDTDELTVRLAREIGQELNQGSPSMGIARHAAIDGHPVLMADRDSNQEFGARESIIRNKIVSAMCAPLRIGDRLLGSIYIDTSKPTVTFSDEDLELFTSLASQSAMALDLVRLHEEVVEAEKRRQSFGRFLSPAIVDKIMSEQGNLELGGQRTTVTTLFCDIRGFTNTAERIPPADLVSLLNEYFTAMTQIIFDHDGTLDKYVGDEIMAVFGAPVSTGDDPYQAVRAAQAIQARNIELNAARRAEGRSCIELGIGIDSGEVTAGYFGSPMRMEFTVIGDRVNTAARFCGMAGPGQIVAGEETWNAIKDRINGRCMGALELKGKAKAVPGYEILPD